MPRIDHSVQLDELASLRVLSGECPPDCTGGPSGCAWAEDCLSCWWSYLDKQRAERERFERRRR